MKRQAAPAGSEKGLGKIRICDGSLKGLGINRGDLVLVQLGSEPDADGDLCAAFIPTGRLVIRRYHKEQDGHVRLDKGPDAKVIQLFAPDAVMIIGSVARVVPACEGGE
jgi:SOS-response transcriptional repressor LexA